MKLTEAKLKQLINETLEITSNERKIADLLTGSADDANLGLSFMESLGMTPHIGKQSSGPHLSYPKSRLEQPFEVMRNVNYLQITESLYEAIVEESKNKRVNVGSSVGMITDTGDVRIYLNNREKSRTQDGYYGIIQVHIDERVSAQ
tara:strand:+ start:776 stop:1216 length:441 start_codon:yes stop_codon:yes gene_type:complete